MRRWAALPLLAASLAAGTDDEKSVRDETYNFEIAMPSRKADDWDKLAPAPDRQDVRARFKTEFAGTEPVAFAEVQVLVVPLNKLNAARGIDALAQQWAFKMEDSLQNPRELKEGKTTLGGQEAYFRDLQGDYLSGVAHVTWHLTRMGKFAYTLYAIRAFQAVGNRDLEGEIAEIRDSFRFLRIEEVKGDPRAKETGPGGPAGVGREDKGPDPALLERKKVKLDHWRFQCVKPEGLLEVPPDKFEESEIANHMVAKFERAVEQTRLTIRIYAQIEKSQQYTVEQLAEHKIKYFEKMIEEKNRLKPEIDNDHQKKFPPLAKKSIRLKLVGKRKMPETWIWYLAQCKNERQYQIEIYYSGTTGEQHWKDQVEDFLKSFKPFDD